MAHIWQYPPRGKRLRRVGKELKSLTGRPITFFRCNLSFFQLLPDDVFAIIDFIHAFLCLKTVFGYICKCNSYLSCRVCHRAVFYVTCILIFVTCCYVVSPPLRRALNKCAIYPQRPLSIDRPRYIFPPAGVEAR